MTKLMEPLKAEDVVKSWWSPEKIKGLAAVIDKDWHSHENRHPNTNGSPHGWVSTYAGSGGARDVVFTWSGYREQAIAEYVVALHNKALRESSLFKPPADRLPEPGSVGWYQHRLVEEREDNRRLMAQVAELEGQVAAVRSVVCVPCTRPHPGDDDA